MPGRVLPRDRPAFRHRQDCDTFHLGSRQEPAARRSEAVEALF